MNNSENTTKDDDVFTMEKLQKVRELVKANDARNRDAKQSLDDGEVKAAVDKYLEAANPAKLLKHIITVEITANNFDEENGFDAAYHIKHDRVIEGMEAGCKADLYMNDMAKKLAMTIKHLLTAGTMPKKKKKFNGRR